MTPRDFAVDQNADVDEDEMVNINNFIFDPLELEDRQQRRFASRKK